VYRQADVVAVAAGAPKLPALVGGFPALGAENAAAWAPGAAAPAALDLGALRPEFLHPVANPFYAYPLGELSPYGHEALLLFRSLVKERGFAAGAFAADSAAALKAYPAAGGRLNGLSKAFLTNYNEQGARPPACGVKDNSEGHSLVRVPPLVAAGADAAVIEEAIRTQQDNDLAVACGLAFAAILARGVATGDDVASLLTWAANAEAVPSTARAAVAAAAAAAAGARDVRALALDIGMSCGLPGALTLSLAIAARHGDDFVAAQRANMLAGGDCASRAAVVGALAAARAGGVPDAWLSRVTLKDELLSGADALLALRRD
jgi:ADP-ribosylglycohydrolase